MQLAKMDSHAVWLGKRWVEARGVLCIESRTRHVVEDTGSMEYFVNQSINLV
jgi:hypothetical protein